MDVQLVKKFFHFSLYITESIHHFFFYIDPPSLSIFSVANSFSNNISFKEKLNMNSGKEDSCYIYTRYCKCIMPQVLFKSFVPEKSKSIDPIQDLSRISNLVPLQLLSGLKLTRHLQQWKLVRTNLRRVSGMRRKTQF